MGAQPDIVLPKGVKYSASVEKYLGYKIINLNLLFDLNSGLQKTQRQKNKFNNTMREQTSPRTVYNHYTHRRINVIKKGRYMEKVLYLKD